MGGHWGGLRRIIWETIWGPFGRPSGDHLGVHLGDNLGDHLLTILDTILELRMLSVPTCTDCLASPHPPAHPHACNTNTNTKLRLPAWYQLPNLEFQTDLLKDSFQSCFSVGEHCCRSEGITDSAEKDCKKQKNQEFYKVMKEAGGEPFRQMIAQWQAATGKTASLGSRKNGHFAWAEYHFTSCPRRHPPPPPSSLFPPPSSLLPPPPPPSPLPPCPPTSLPLPSHTHNPHGTI